MKRSEVNTDPDRARKRALSDARCAWRKMSAEQRAEFLAWIEPWLSMHPTCKATTLNAEDAR